MLQMRSFLSLILIGMAFGFTVPVWAQETAGHSNNDENASKASDDDYMEKDSDQDDYVTIEPVSVRAARESRDLKNDRGASGTVLLSEDFDDAGIALPDVLDQQAGVRVTRMGGPGSFSTLSIRGSTSDQILIVLDGVPLNSGSGGPVDLSRIPLGNIERIEIYRGVSPILFGSSAIGGVVSISTRSARERQLSASLGGGSYGAREARLFFAEPQQGWEFGFGLDYSGCDGSFAYTNDNGTRFNTSDDRKVTRRNNGYDQINLLGKLRLHVSDDWSLTLTEWLFWRTQGVPGLGQYETEKSSYESLENLSVLSAEGRNLGGVADWVIQASFRYTQSRFDDPFDEIGLTGTDSADRSYAPYLASSTTIRPVDWWDISAQIGYRYERFNSSQQEISLPASQRHSLSAGIETGFLVDAIDLLILPSGRVEWADSSLLESAGASTSELRLNDSTQSQWSFRGALVNQSIPDTKLMVSGGRAVRMPSLFELFGNTGRVVGNTELQPETAYSVDAGLIYDSNVLPDPYRLRVELSGFYSTVNDLIQYVQTAQNVAKAENIDQARLWGIEAGLRADLFGHLRVNGNYSFLDATNTGDIAAREGKYLPFRPASKWYVRAEGYMKEIPNLDELAIFLDAEWIAGNFLDNANLVAVHDRFYLNSGFSLELSHSAARLSFSANNLTDERTADLAGYPLPGRSYYLFVTVKVL
jgi:iron complex outermembrane receptor protein